MLFLIGKNLVICTLTDSCADTSPDVFEESACVICGKLTPTAYVKSCSSAGISPIQRPFARAKVGILFLSRESTHMEEMLRQVLSIRGFKSGFLATPSTLSKLILL
jgi:hypothetical protein